MIIEGKGSLVRKTFQIYIESVTFHGRGDLCLCSANSALLHQFNAKATFEIGKNFKAEVIGTIYQNDEQNDAEIALQIECGQFFTRKLSFRFSKQKIKSVQSAKILKEQFNGASGYINYRLLSFSAVEIGKGEYEASLQQKRKIMEGRLRDVNETRKDKDSKQLQERINEKDKKIKELSDRIVKMQSQSLSFKKKMENQALPDSKITITNQNVFVQWKKAQKKIETYESEINDLKENLASLEKQNEGLYERINRLLKEKATLEQRQNESAQLRQQSGSYAMEGAGKFKEFEKVFFQSIGQLEQQEEQEEEAELEKNKGKEQNNNNSYPSQSLQKIQTSPKTPIKILSQVQLDPDTPCFSKVKSEENLHQSTCQKPICSREVSLPGKATQNFEFQIKKLSIRLESKQRQIEMLAEQIKKKDKTIEAARQKQNAMSRNVRLLQSQKAKLFSSLSQKQSSSMSGNDLAKSLKQLSSYNQQIIKQNEQLAKQIEQLKVKVSSQELILNKFDEQMKKKQIKISEFQRQKQLWLSREKNLVMSVSTVGNLQENQKLQLSTVQTKASMSNFESQLLTLKQENQKLRNQKEKLLSNSLCKKVQKNQPNQQLITLKQKASLLEQDNKKLKAQLSKINSELKQSLRMNQRYFDLERKFERLHKLASKVEHQLNNRLQKQEIQLLRGDIEKIVDVLFLSINDFQKEFYSILENSFKVCSAALAKYYKQLGEIQTEKLVIHAQFQRKQGQKMLNFDQSKQSGERMKEIVKKKDEIQKQKQQKQKQIDEQISVLKQKKRKKLLTIKKQIKAFQEGVKLVEEKIKELFVYKDGLNNFFQKEMNNFSELKKNQTELKDRIGSKDNANLGEKGIINSTLSKRSYATGVGSNFQKMIKNTNLPPNSSAEQAINRLPSLCASLAQKFTCLMVNSESKQSNPVLKKEQLQEPKKQIGNKLQGLEKNAMSIQQNAALFQESLSKDQIIMKLEQREKDLLAEIKAVKADHEKGLTSFKLQLQQLQKWNKQSTKRQNQILYQKNELSQRITLLTKELKQGNWLLQSTEHEKQELKKTCQDLQHRIKQQMNIEKRLNEQMSQIVKTSQVQAGNLKKIVQQKIDYIEKMQKENSKEIESLKKNVQTLENQLYIEINNSEVTNKKNKNLIDRYEQSIQNMEINAEDLKEEIQKLSRECKEFSDEKSFLMQQNERLKKRMDFLIENHEESELQHLKACNLIESYQKEKVMMIQSQKQFQRKVDELKAEYEDGIFKERKKIRELEDACTKLQNEKQLIIEEDKKSKLLVQQTQREVGKLNDQVNEERKQVATLQEQIIAKTSEFFKITQQLQAALRQSKNSEQKIYELELDNQRLEEQLSSFCQQKAKIQVPPQPKIKSKQTPPKPPGRSGQTPPKSSLKSKEIDRVMLDNKCSPHSYQNQPMSARPILRSPVFIQKQLQASIKMKISASTKIRDIVEDSQQLQEFSSLTISQLIGQIKALRRQTKKLSSSLSIEKEEKKVSRKSKQIVGQGYKLVEEIKRLQRVEKDLRAQIVRHQVREKKLDRELKQKKQELQEQEKRGDQAIKEIVRFSQLTNHLQRENQKLRIEISRGEISVSSRQSYTINDNRFQEAPKELKSLLSIDHSTLNSEIISLKKKLSRVKQELSMKCAILQGLQRQGGSDRVQRYKQKYDRLTKEMLTVVASYRKLQNQNNGLKYSLKQLTRSQSNKKLVGRSSR